MASGFEPEVERLDFNLQPSGHGVKQLILIKGWDIWLAVSVGSILAGASAALYQLEPVTQNDLAEL